MLLKHQRLLASGIRELHKRIEACDSSQGNQPTCYTNIQPRIQDSHEIFGMSVREGNSQDTVAFADGAYCDTYAQVEQLGVDVSTRSEYFPAISRGDKQAMSRRIRDSLSQSSSTFRQAEPFLPITPGDEKPLPRLNFTSSSQSSCAYSQTEPSPESEVNKVLSISGYTLDEGQSNICFQSSGIEPNICADSDQLFLSSNYSRLALDQVDQEVELDALKRLYFLNYC
jgi:hypothetical protein